MEPITIAALLAILFTLALVLTLFIVAMTFLNKTKKAIVDLKTKVNEVAKAIFEHRK